MKTSHILLAAGAAALGIYLISKSKTAAADPAWAAYLAAGSPSQQAAFAGLTPSQQAFALANWNALTAAQQATALATLNNHELDVLPTSGGTGATTVLDPLPDQTHEIVPNLGTPPLAPAGPSGNSVNLPGQVVSATPFTDANVAAGPNATSLAFLPATGTSVNGHVVAGYNAVNVNGHIVWYPHD